MGLQSGAQGLSTGPGAYRWADRDTVLYALGVGVGCGARPDELAFVTENSHDLPQRVLPTFAVIACDANLAVTQAGTIDWAKPNGATVTVATGPRRSGHPTPRPLPAAGELDVTSTISAIHDKGASKNAVIVMNGRGKAGARGPVIVSSPRPSVTEPPSSTRTESQGRGGQERPESILGCRPLVRGDHAGV